MLFLARWARKLSWKETAASFHTTWDKVSDAVQYVVDWGLAHRSLGPISAIGLDEIQYAKGCKFLTLVYPIDSASTRLRWIGQERTIEAFPGFSTMLRTELSSHIQFVCSDMWKPYLRVVRDKCSQVLHILDRFHIVAKMNEALDDVSAAESRQAGSRRLRTSPPQVPLVHPQAQSHPHFATEVPATRLPKTCGSPRTDPQLLQG